MKKNLKIVYKRYFNHITRLNRCRNRIFHEKLHISMYIRHIDHRSGAPWGPHGREGGKKFSRQSRENFFPGKGPHGGPHGGAPWGAHGVSEDLSQAASGMFQGCFRGQENNL